LGDASSPQPYAQSFGLPTSIVKSVTSFSEALTTSDQQIYMVSDNLSNPQVTPIGVYYHPGGKPPYPPLVGKPIYGSQPFT